MHSTEAGVCNVHAGRLLESQLCTLLAARHTCARMTAANDCEYDRLRCRVKEPPARSSKNSAAFVACMRPLQLFSCDSDGWVGQPVAAPQVLPIKHSSSSHYSMGSGIDSQLLRTQQPAPHSTARHLPVR